jgi:hypothetical protein
MLVDKGSPIDRYISQEATVSEWEALLLYDNLVKRIGTTTHVIAVAIT